MGRYELENKKVDEQEPYDSGGYAQTCELLLIVGARFSAVVCDEDNLFAYGR